MKGLEKLEVYVEGGDHFLSMDVEKGYRHMRLHQSMRDWFIFR